jgi:hypothetical protein
MTTAILTMGIVAFVVAAAYSDYRRDVAVGKVQHEINNLTVRINGLEARQDRMEDRL